MKNKTTKKTGKKSLKGSKSIRNNVKSSTRGRRVKAVILLCVALFFLAYMFYAGGTIGSFFALIIGIVCGLVGVLYLK